MGYILAGSLLFIVIILIILIKQNQLQNQIKEQKETFEKLYLESSDCVVLAENARFLDCNDATLRMLEYRSKEEFMGLSPATISPVYQPDGRRSDEKSLEMIQIATRNGSHRFEWVHKKSSGATFWVDVVLTPILLSKKNIIHATWRSIDERKKLEHQSKLLTHQSKKAALGRLMSLIAHQWRQPLSTINGIITKAYHDLNRADLDPKMIQQELLRVESITEELSNAIRKIHDFYVHEETTPKEETSIRSIINECIEMLYPSFAQTLQPNIEMIEKDPIKISGYTYGMHQIILTLLTNCEEIFAIRNTKNPHITIKLSKNQGYSTIIVTDNGGGIEITPLEKIFEPFVSSKNEVKKIRGMGLCIAKEIVEHHLKGSIEAINFENGAQFIIRYQEYENQ